MSAPDELRFHTLEDVARILHLKSSRHLERNRARWAAAGIGARVTSSWLYTDDDVRAIVALHRAQPDDDGLPTVGGPVLPGRATRGSKRNTT